LRFAVRVVLLGAFAAIADEELIDSVGAWGVAAVADIACSHQSKTIVCSDQIAAETW